MQTAKQHLLPEFQQLIQNVHTWNINHANLEFFIIHIMIYGISGIILLKDFRSSKKDKLIKYFHQTIL